MHATIIEDRPAVETTAEAQDWVAPEPAPATEPQQLAPPARSVQRSFAGFPLTSIALVAALAGLAGWDAWMTREVMALRHQKIVSVSLATIITDFVRDQSRAQGSPQEAAARTRAYLAATQKALLDLARNGTPVVASEAVLGNSVPDRTDAVKAVVARAVAAPGGQH